MATSTWHDVVTLSQTFESLQDYNHFIGLFFCPKLIPLFSLFNGFSIPKNLDSLLFFTYLTNWGLTLFLLQQIDVSIYAAPVFF